MAQSCILDALLPDDLPALCSLFTCPVGREFLGGSLDAELALRRSLDWIHRPSSAAIWAIRRKGDRGFLGYVLLDAHHNSVDTEISYALLPENWGRGYATDALIEAFTRARQDFDLEELVAETQAKNHRSIKLLERIGMIEDSRLVRFGEEQVVYRIELKPADQ